MFTVVKFQFFPYKYAKYENIEGIMSRKPEYRLNEVFEAAIPLILSQGYRGCSMQTLINTTDFNRRAFYIEFTNKQDFIQALLAYYIDQKLEPLQIHLHDNRNILSAIIRYFEAYQAQIEEQGCLLVRLIIELGKENENIKNLAQHYYDNLQLAFIACLERATIHKELNDSINIESLALKLNYFAKAFAISNSIQEDSAQIMLVIKTLFNQTS